MSSFLYNPHPFKLLWRAMGIVKQRVPQQNANSSQINQIYPGVSWFCFLSKFLVICPVLIRLRFLLFPDFPWNLFKRSISHLLPSRSKAILSNRLNPAASNSALLSLSSFRNLECILYIPGDFHFICLLHNLFNSRLLFRWVPCQEGFWFWNLPSSFHSDHQCKGFI